MLEFKNTTITVESPDAENFMKKIVLEVSSEMMIDEWIPIFRLILQFLTYGQDSIDEFLPLEDE